MTTHHDDIRNLLDNIVRLRDDDFDAIRGKLTYKKLDRKGFFLEQGQVCRQLGLITKGYVRLYYLVDGVEITKDFNFENFICGSWASFSLQQPSRFNIVAMEDLDVYTIGRTDLYELLDKYPAIEKMARMQIEKMFIRKEMREASFLLDNAEQRYHRLLEEEPQMVRRVPLKYLASYLGLSAETLSRVRNNALKK